MGTRLRRERLINIPREALRRTSRLMALLLSRPNRRPISTCEKPAPPNRNSSLRPILELPIMLADRNAFL